MVSAMIEPRQPRPSANGVRNVLIVEDDTLVGIGLSAILQRLGHRVAGQAATAQEARRMFRETSPDLVLMDIRLDDSDGIELTRELLTERRCPVVIISAYSEPELISRAAAVGVFGYIVKPVTHETLKAQIAVAIKRFDDLEQVRRERDQLSQTLELRKLVERAKGILMKKLGLDEETAHRRLQLEAQKRRVTIGEVSKRVIDAEKRS
jgi:response regulator NasT